MGNYDNPWMIPSLNLRQTDACSVSQEEIPRLDSRICFSVNLQVRYLGRHVIWRPETSKVQWSVRRACQGMVTAMLLTKPSTISRGAPRDSKSSLTAWEKTKQSVKSKKREKWLHICLITLGVDFKANKVYSQHGRREYIHSDCLDTEERHT